VSAHLVWLRPDGEEVEFALVGSPLLVGRDAGADIRVDEPLVSRAHARIERRSGTATRCASPARAAASWPRPPPIPWREESSPSSASPRAYSQAPTPPV